MDIKSIINNFHDYFKEISEAITQDDLFSFYFGIYNLNYLYFDNAKNLELLLKEFKLYTDKEIKNSKDEDKPFNLYKLETNNLEKIEACLIEIKQFYIYQEMTCTLPTSKEVNLNFLTLQFMYILQYTHLLNFLEKSMSIKEFKDILKVKGIIEGENNDRRKLN